MDKYFVPRPRIIMKEYGGWSTLYDLRKRKSLDINKEGALLLKQIIGKRVNEVLTKLAKELTPIEMESIQKFLEELIHEGWLSISTQPSKLKVIRGPLEAVYIEVLRICNLNCNHCYLPEWKSKMSFNDFSLILNEASELGAYKTSITGGEPLLHPDIYKMIQYAYDLEFDVNLQTNATLLTSHIVQKLTKYDVSITTSLDGLENVHDEFRGMSGAFSRTLSGIRLAKEAGLPVRVNVTLHSKNIDSIRKLLLMLNRLEVDEINVFYPIFTGKAKTMNDIVPFLKAVKILYENEDLIGYKKYYNIAMYSGNCTFCGIAECFLFITARGDVTLCPAFSGDETFYIGNIHQHTLSELWNSKKRRDLLDRLQCKLIQDVPIPEDAKADVDQELTIFSGKNPSAPDVIFCNLWRLLFSENIKESQS